MASFRDIIVSASDLVGSAVASYNKAKNQFSEKTDFVAGLADQTQWNGGTLSNLEASQMRAIRNSWFFTGINTKALDLSSSKFGVFYNPTGLEDDGVPAEGHPFMKAIRRPNPYMGKQMLFMYLQWWMDLQGEAFIFVESDGSKGIKGFWPLPSNSMDIEFTPDKKNIQSYILKLSRWYYIHPDYIIHIKYPNPFDFFRGMPPLIASMLTIDADLAMKMWNGAFFGKDNVMPSAIISLGSGNPEQLLDPKDVDAVTSDLTNEYSAIKRKTVVTNANTMAVAMLGYNAKDMDFLLGMQWNKEEILWSLGVPAGMIDKNSTEANAKVGNKIFKDNMWGIKGLVAGEFTSQALKWYSEDLEMRYEDDRVYDRELELREAEFAKDVMTKKDWGRKYFDYELKEGEVSMNEEKATKQVEQQMLLGSGDEMQKSSDKKKEEAKKPAKATSNTIPTKKSITNEYQPWLELGQTEEEYFNNLKLQELKSVKNKAKNFFRENRINKFNYTGNFIDEETMKSIVSDIQGVEQRNDIDEVIAHWKSYFENFNAEGYIKANKTFRLWSEFEQPLANAIFKAFQDILNYLIGNVSETMIEDSSIWQVVDNILATAMKPLFQDIASKAVSENAKLVEFTVSYNLVNEKAREIAFVTLLENIVALRDTTKRAIQRALQEWRDSGKQDGLQGLIDRLPNITDGNGNPVFDMARAERVAKSEAVEAYASATNATLVENGFPPAVYKPKAHGGCRCYIQPGFMSDGSKVIVWFTVHDEMVCKQELETPWGTVQGCKELHMTIVSEGKAGQKMKTLKSLMKGGVGSGDKLGHPFRGNQWTKQDVFNYTSPDTDITIKAYKDQEGYYRNAEKLTVYWGSNIPPSKLMNFSGGKKDSENSNSGSNHFVTPDIEQAKGFSELMKERSGGKMWLYKFELLPGEGWLSYKNPSNGDGIELAVDIDKNRIEVYATELISVPGEWTKSK